MKLSRQPPRPAAAFTMIEIAMALAVIGFALVAIIGVLPQGMDVQKENRRETIINQDANYLLQAIRGGAQGLNDLTNYVMSITNYWTTYGAATNLLNTGMDVYSNLPTAKGNDVTSIANCPPFALTNGANIIGLLSTPEYVPLANGGFQSNYIVAYFHAISGEAAEKYPQTNLLIEEAAFGYRLVSQIVPWGTSASYGDPSWTNFADPSLMTSPNLAIPLVTNWAQSLATNGNLSITNFTAYYTNAGALDTVNIGNLGIINISGGINYTNVFVDRANRWVVDRTMQTNLYDVRLLFRWLLLPNGQVGNSRQTYRMMAGSTMTNQLIINTNVTPWTTNLTPFWYFQPESYSALNANLL
jgi:type II secretory pathway pseudopilin PulG